LPETGFGQGSLAGLALRARGRLHSTASWAKPSFRAQTPMGNLKKKRRLKMNKHKRRKRLKSNRHKKRTWQK